MGMIHRGPGAALAVLIASALACLLATPAFAAKAPRIEVLSNRADLISAGDALVAVTPPKGVDASGLRVTLNGKSVTGDFAVRENGRFAALLDGLRNGRNKLTARASGGRASKLNITNHPNGGPVFSGPQIQPWVCQEEAVDEQCNQPADYDLKYMPPGGAALQPYDEANPPSSVAEVTTDQGKTVPYIVRVETGYQARDQYKIAVLYDPSKPWAPWAPQDGWNHKLLITHGASCGIDRKSGEAPGVEVAAALERGFAVMSTALNNAGHNCNLVTQAESMVMAKERIVEQYGEIRYTIGTGCSGGSLTQQQVANAYPGIYQGILPQCSFPDAWSTGQQLVDYHLLRLYIENPTRWAPGVAWTPTQIAAVEGHPNHVNSIILDTLYWTDARRPRRRLARRRGRRALQRPDEPGRRPLHARRLHDQRCSGRGPRALWGDAEKKLGHGFAGLPLDNVGVQYGLDALMTGAINPEQFVDLNAKVGGGTSTSIRPRSGSSPTSRRCATSTGLGGVNTTNNLDEVAIIDLRGPDPGAFHDAYRTWAIRSRLERQHGTFDNHVIWFGAVPCSAT